MKNRLGMDKIDRGLGAERRGTVRAAGGYFGAIQVNARRGLWQLAQARVPSLESCRSKNSRRPSSTFSCVTGFSSGTGM